MQLSVSSLLLLGLVALVAPALSVPAPPPPRGSNKELGRAPSHPTGEVRQGVGALSSTRTGHRRATAATRGVEQQWGYQQHHTYLATEEIFKLFKSLSLRLFKLVPLIGAEREHHAEDISRDLAEVKATIERVKAELEKDSDLVLKGIVGSRIKMLEVIFYAMRADFFVTRHLRFVGPSYKYLTEKSGELLAMTKERGATALEGAADFVPGLEGGRQRATEFAHAVPDRVLNAVNNLGSPWDVNGRVGQLATSAQEKWTATVDGMKERISQWSSEDEQGFLGQMVQQFKALLRAGNLDEFRRSQTTLIQE